MHKLEGAGLPNVYLMGGVTVEGDGDDQTVAYANIDGLYKEISRAIAFRLGVMSGLELRFLRKRLGLSQAEVARFGGKTEQAVAKWEKGQSPVPTAEARLVKLAVLSRFGTKEEISRVVSQLANNASKLSQYPYVIRYDQGGWKQDEDEAISTVHGTSSDRLIEFGNGMTVASPLRSAPTGNTVLAGELVERGSFPSRSSTDFRIVNEYSQNAAVHEPQVSL